jgi:hypothetical protein
LSNTTGTIPATRSSKAPVSHVVHPRFDAPVTTKRRRPPSTDWSAHIARTAAFVMGKRRIGTIKTTCGND